MMRGDDLRLFNPSPFDEPFMDGKKNKGGFDYNFEMEEIIW